MRPGGGRLPMDKLGPSVGSPSVFSSGTNSAGRPGEWMEDSEVSRSQKLGNSCQLRSHSLKVVD